MGINTHKEDLSYESSFLIVNVNTTFFQMKGQRQHNSASKNDYIITPLPG